MILRLLMVTIAIGLCACPSWARREREPQSPESGAYRQAVVNLFSAAGYKWRARCFSQITGTDLGFVYAADESGLDAACAAIAVKPITTEHTGIGCLPSPQDPACTPYTPPPPPLPDPLVPAETDYRPALKVGGVSTAAWDDFVFRSQIKNYLDLRGVNVAFVRDPAGYTVTLSIGYYSPQCNLRTRENNPVTILLRVNDDATAIYDLADFNVGDKPQSGFKKTTHVPYTGALHGIRLALRAYCV